MNRSPGIAFFDLKARGTSLATEINGGLTTFLTMSYIIFVQPIILANCGMDPGAVMVATCVASAIGTLAMGVLTNYPIALAPAMGHNLFFAFTVCGVMGYTWQVALAANFVAGIAFLILTLIGVQTAQDDDPRLTVRLPGQAERQLLRVVLDPTL